MVRTIATLAFFLCASMSASAGDHVRHCDAGEPHIRATAPVLAHALAEGVLESPTLEALVERIEASDLLVYLTFDRAMMPSTAGHITLMGTGGGRRYVRLSVNPRFDGRQRLAILGHELRHAVEIADAGSVIDQPSLASLYRRIGFRSGERSYESDAAIAAGRQVQDELARRQRAHVTGTH